MCRADDKNFNTYVVVIKARSKNSSRPIFQAEENESKTKGRLVSLENHRINTFKFQFDSNGLGLNKRVAYFTLTVGGVYLL
jgi:hypothetical protein